MPKASARSIVEKFCLELPREIQQVNAILNAQSDSRFDHAKKLKSLQEECHRLRGSSYCMGFPALGAEFTKMEQDCALPRDPKEAMDPRKIERIRLRLAKVKSIAGKLSADQSRLVHRLENATRPVKTDDARQIHELFRKQKILFVEDDISVRNLIRELLADLGVGEIQLATCGQEALDRLRSFTPTLIISDWHMKPVDGFTLLKEVRRGRTAVSAQTAFIFLTSENNAEKIQAIIRNGVDHVLVKPFNRSVVMKAVMHVAQTNAVDVRGPSPAQPAPKPAPPPAPPKPSSPPDDDYFMI